MLLFLSVVAAGAFAIVVQAQSSETKALYVQPSVPTGIPVAGNYTGALRPQIHYSPPQFFMVSRRWDPSLALLLFLHGYHS